MVELEVNNATVVKLDFTPGMTATDLQQKFQDHQLGKHYRLNTFQLHDPSQSRIVNPTDEIVDERRYSAIVWVHSIVDDQGNRITEGLV